MNAITEIAKSWIRSLTVGVGVAVSISMIWSCGGQSAPELQAPLFDNLGSYSWEVTTDNEYARKFFNQGIIMANGFNHGEAARAFREAIRLDPNCAMAHWGLAYVLGPNYNDGSMNPDNLKEVLDAIATAESLSSKVSEWEQSLIAAMRIKFPSHGTSVEGEAFSEAMKEASRKHPNNDGVATLYAESIMNLHAWDLYTVKGGDPKPWTPQITATLEKALELNPDNPLANHLYIHAVEASANIERARKSAEKLSHLVSGSGHLVHMPSHFYINTGEYAKGSDANEQAVIMDSLYIAQCKVNGVYPQLYYPHNYHFLVATAALEGRGAKAIEAAFKMADIIDRNYLDQPGYETTQHYITTPYNTLVKFAQWEKLTSLPEPREDLLYPTAIWHYGQGMAYANLGRQDQAEWHLQKVEEFAKMPELEAMKIWDINNAAQVASIASLVLKAELLKLDEKYQDAAEALLEAIDIEDALIYQEPPDWFFSVRHMLGDVYLRMGEAEKAKVAFEEDLAEWPLNGFALNGLYHSLLQLDNNEDATKVKAQFEEAWQRADSQLEFSRIDESKRVDLALNIKSDSPDNLIYIAGTSCRIK